MRRFGVFFFIFFWALRGFMPPQARADSNSWENPAETTEDSSLLTGGERGREEGQIHSRFKADGDDTYEEKDFGSNREFKSKFKDADPSNDDSAESVL